MYLFEGMCVSHCPLGTYENVDVVTNPICSQCDPSCAACIGGKDAKFLRLNV